MRRTVLAGAAVAVASLAMIGSADAAWRGGFRGGFYGPHAFFGPRIGFGIYAPLWVPPVYYAPPPVVVQQGYAAPYAAPPVAPEPPAAAGPANPGYWYYCNSPQGYYPYIRECTGQWMTVPANPNGGPQG